MIDQLYRKAVLTVAERPEIEKLMRQRAWPLAQRFVAGEDIPSALQAVRELQKDGIAANLDLLGDNLHVVAGWPTLNARFDGPTWWIVGGRSDYVQPSDMAAMRALFPRVVSVTLKRAGHWVHADEPQAFIEILREFLPSPR